MPLVDDIKKISLNAIINPDSEANFRKICRSYSKKFHTPLHQVAQLPLEFILQAFFEDLFDEMDDDELRKQAQLAIETLEERQAREKAEEDFMEALEQEALEEQKKDLASLKDKSSLKPKDIQEPEQPDISISIVDDEELGKSVKDPFSS
jgi:hypothetical protein